MQPEPRSPTPSPSRPCLPLKGAQLPAHGSGVGHPRLHLAELLQHGPRWGARAAKNAQPSSGKPEDHTFAPVRCSAVQTRYLRRLCMARWLAESECDRHQKAVAAAGDTPMRTLVRGTQRPGPLVRLSVRRCELPSSPAARVGGARRCPRWRRSHAAIALAACVSTCSRPTEVARRG